MFDIDSLIRKDNLGKAMMVVKGLIDFSKTKKLPIMKPKEDKSAYVNRLRHI